MILISSLFYFVSLFFEINFLTHLEGSVLVVDQGVVDAVDFSGEGEPSPRVVVDDAVAVGAHCIVNIGDSAGDGSVPSNFGIKHFHLGGLVGTDPFVGTG